MRTFTPPSPPFLALDFCVKAEQLPNLLPALKHQLLGMGALMIEENQTYTHLYLKNRVERMEVYKDGAGYAIISLLSEDTIFEPLLYNQGNDKSSYTKGKQVAEKFKRMIRAIQPLYAAITVEYRLETPRELREDERSLAFRDFYVCKALLGKNTKDRVANEIFIDPIEQMGEYISTTQYFNPQKMKTSDNHLYIQNIIRNILALDG